MATATDKPSGPDEPVDVPYLPMVLIAAIVFTSVSAFDPPIVLGGIVAGVLVCGGRALLVLALRRRRHCDQLKRD